jgi:minor extracellular serine protease Vpr
MLETVNALGVIVVVAAGNSGPDPSTMNSPADAPSVIAVGAVNNDRFFADSVVLPDNTSLVAVPGSGIYNVTSVTGTLVDVTNLDTNGLACSTLPDGSLSGNIALIFRGICTFETKINNARKAGATAVIVYDNNPSESPIIMGVQAATLPAVFVSNADGLALQAKLTGPLAVTVQFVPGPYYTDPASIANFSSQGPNVDFSIKPDLMAVGQNILTATQKLDSKGDMYDPSGYTVTQGTSFSTPLVAGAAAVVKQAHPGLTADQYRSLLINSAALASLVPGTAASVQQGGAGVLDVLAAVNGTVAAAPVSLSFGAGGDTIDATQNLTLTNVGTISDTFQISVAPANSSASVPQLDSTSLTLDPGASATLPVRFRAASLNPGAYEGFIDVQGVHSGTTARVPYWYAVPSGQPAHVTVLHSPTTGAAGSRLSNAIYFRVTDAAGIPVTSVAPSVTAVSTGSQAGAVSSVDFQYPGAYAFTVRLAAQPGSNVYQIQAGSLTATVTIVGQ